MAGANACESFAPIFQRIGLVPFLGAGGGGLYSAIDLERLTASGRLLGDSNDSLDPAYQAFAGLKYAYNDRLDVGVVYKYLVADTPEWKLNGSPVRAEAVKTHSVSLVLSYRF